MRLVKYTPLRDLWDLEKRVNRMFHDFLPTPFRGEERLGAWEPAIDVYETGKGYTLKAELPEVKEEDVHVNVEGNILTITGERKREEEIREEHYHRTERSYGSFSRSFALPESVDREKIRATFKGGVMKLELPGREEIKPKEIKIEIEK